jgi:penicillin-binding protein 1A
MTDEQYSRRKAGKKPNRRQKKSFSWGRLILTVFGWLLTLGVIGTLAGAALFFHYAADAPSITESDLSSDSSTRLLDMKGNVVYTVARQERDYVQAEDIPDSLKNAVISIEDRRFYEHQGVDPIRIIGAALANFRGSSLGLQGGSTLTQQLVKQSVFSTKASDQTLKRKAQEAWLALRVEKNFSKDQILTFYINKSYMGNGIYGMKTAAQYYYDKQLSELTLAQTALLAGIPQGPNTYSPYSIEGWEDYATNRRNNVLQAMANNGVVTQAEADKAAETSVTEGLADLSEKAAAVNTQNLITDGYISSVLQQLREEGYNLETDHLTVYTNLDMDLQQKLYDVVNNGSVSFASDLLQVGATMMDPNDGRVVAQLSGRKLTEVRGTNRALLTSRSSGSTIKPLIDYAPAIEYLNWPTYRTLSDTPHQYLGTDIDILNWDGKYMDNITMRKALAQSRNVPAVRTLEEVGGARAKAFLSKLGIALENEPGGSAAIGIELSTEQEAAAFAAFANGGIYYEPSYITKVVTSDGVTHTYESEGKRAMKESTAFMMTDMMKDVISDNATAPDAQIDGLHQAGKSGLNGYDAELTNHPDRAIQDSWFTGYTKKYSLAIWTGYDYPNEEGHYIDWDDQELPSQIYQQVMSYAMQNQPNEDWQAPSSVTQTTKGGKKEYEVAGANWSNGGLPAVTFRDGVAKDEKDLDND